MAEAVGQLYPSVKFGIGPAIEDGFYYDFDLPETLSEEDLARIEAKMREIIQQDQPFRRRAMTKEEAKAALDSLGIRVLDGRSGSTQEFGSRFLIMATGGAGQLFKLTTNPPVATGDGVVLGFKCGAEIIDMEFYQSTLPPSTFPPSPGRPGSTSRFRPLTGSAKRPLTSATWHRAGPTISRALTRLAEYPHS
jgi:hypothetical protein